MCSIDGFQGRERDVINHHLQHSEVQPANSLGFLDKYRINVLLTRAKRGLVGIGCRRILSQGSHIWNQWLGQAHTPDYDFIKKDPSSHEVRGIMRPRDRYHKDYKERKYDKAHKHNITIEAGQK